MRIRSLAALLALALDSGQKQGGRLSAWVRTDGIPASGRGGARLVLTAMRGSSIIAHEFMKKSRLRGTGDWKRVSIELALPARTTRLEAGATLEGDDTVWVDDFEFEVIER
jgi:hypothetical protein